MKNTSAWLGRISRFGVKSENEDDISRRVVFSNVIFISLPVVYIIFMIIDLESYLIPISQLRFDQFVVPIVILICFCGLYLNKKGITTLSRVLFIIVWPLLLHLIPIKLLFSPSDYMLAYPFGIVFHGLLIQLMFSFKHEKVLFSFFMLINAIGMISFPALLVYFDSDNDIPRAIVNYRYYFFDGILYWLLFNLVIFYIMHIIESNIQRINDAKLLIENQKEELDSINQNLEMLIEQRTKSLLEQNNKLQKHAFFNAHLLRGPFCRIKGLVNLQELSSEKDDLDAIKVRLEESLAELDSRLHEIQRMVETNSSDI
jgi:signal transduction histidine kinase